MHCLIATYDEPADMVRECVLRLLVAPEPVYMEKLIYVCDDGSAKEEGKAKRDFVRHLRALGALLFVSKGAGSGNAVAASPVHCRIIASQMLFAPQWVAAQVPRAHAWKFMQSLVRLHCKSSRSVGPFGCDELAQCIVSRWCTPLCIVS